MINPSAEGAQSGTRPPFGEEGEEVAEINDAVGRPISGTGEVAGAGVAGAGPPQAEEGQKVVEVDDGATTRQVAGTRWSGLDRPGIDLCIALADVASDVHDDGVVPGFGRRTCEHAVFGHCHAVRKRGRSPLQAFGAVVGEEGVIGALEALVVAERNRDERFEEPAFVGVRTEAVVVAERAVVLGRSSRRCWATRWRFSTGRR